MSSEIEFDEDKFAYGSRPQAGKSPASFSSNVGSQIRYPGAGREPGMVKFLMKHHLAKSPQSAQMFLVGLVIVNFIIAFIIIKFLL